MGENSWPNFTQLSFQFGRVSVKRVKWLGSFGLGYQWDNTEILAQRLFSKNLNIEKTKLA
jgi:hypothetical protein